MGHFTFSIGVVLEEDQNFLEDSVQDEKTKKRKIARALQILHIRQSKFQSLCDASRHDKVRKVSLLVMGSGSKSRVRVGYLIFWVFLRFWGILTFRIHHY